MTTIPLSLQASAENVNGKYSQRECFKTFLVFCAQDQLLFETVTILPGSGLAGMSLPCCVQPSSPSTPRHSKPTHSTPTPQLCAAALGVTRSSESYSQHDPWPEVIPD